MSVHPLGEYLSNTRDDASPTNVGAALANIRIYAGLSQAQLARRLNRCQSFVVKVERGARGVKLREFFWIVDRIGVDWRPIVAQLLESDFQDLQDQPDSEVRRDIEEHARSKSHDAITDGKPSRSSVKATCTCSTRKLHVSPHI